MTQEVYVAPRDLLELQLAQIWEEVLNVRPVSVTSNFFGLGGSSLDAMTLMIHVQEQFKQELPFTALFETATIESIANILRNENGAQTHSPLVALQPDGSRRPFFCVHAVGGTALAYIELARSLGFDQPFYGLEARGLDGRAEPFQQIEEMAAYYLEALRVRQPAGPYMLGGWSFGGVVAFEMAQQLLREGQKVSLLAMLDSSAAAAMLKDLDPEKHASRLLANFIVDLINTRRNHSESRDEDEYNVVYNELLNLDAEAQLNYVWERATKANVIPPNTGVNRIGHLLQIFRSNLIALSRYVPQPYSEEIVVFRASDVKEQVLDPKLGWEELSTRPVEVHVIPGDHYTMLAKPHVQILADKLRSCFDKS